MVLWVIQMILVVNMIMAFTSSLDSKRRFFKIAYFIIFIVNVLILVSTI